MYFADLHCDTLYKMLKKGVNYNDDSLSVRYSDFSQFDKQIRNYAIYLENRQDDPKYLYTQMLNSYNEIKSRVDPDLVVPLLSVEGGALAESGYSVENIKNDGVVIMSLAWNYDNSLAGGSGGFSGITKRGREIISQMNGYGIALDLSHLNKRSFYDAIELADNVLATHSCLDTVMPHKRNISIEQARLIKEKQGVLGICFYPEFLGGNVFEAVYKNVYLLLEAGLEKVITIGSDFDGADMAPELFSILDVPKLYEYLLLKIGDKDILDGIFYKNAEVFVDKLLTNTKK